MTHEFGRKYIFEFPDFIILYNAKKQISGKEARNGNFSSLRRAEPLVIKHSINSNFGRMAGKLRQKCQRFEK